MQEITESVKRELRRIGMFLRGMDIRSAYFDAFCGTVLLNGQPVDVRPAEPKRVHPFDMYDLLEKQMPSAADLIKQTEEKDTRIVYLNGQSYIQDTSLPYHGTNPEFIQFMIKNGGSVVSSK